MRGKAFGKSRIVVGIIILLVIAFVDVYIIKEIGFNFSLIPSAVMIIVAAWILFIKYLFFQVRIGMDGFYCKTNPFNGRYFKYSEIKDYKDIKKVIKHYHRGHGASNRTYYFYFEFTDNSEKKHKFQYEQQIYQHEISVLKERIETAKD